MLTSLVEDIPNGFPRVARFLDSDDSFGLYRRFGTVYSRLLLIKQDEVSRMEMKLEAMDRLDDASNDGKRYLMSHDLDCRREEIPSQWEGESRPQLLGKLEKTVVEYSKWCK